MAKYQHKPTIVEAVKFIVPSEKVKGGCFMTYPIRYNHKIPYIIIHTTEGDMIADPGDWIITGINGEIYPCRDEIFQQIYEKVK